MKLSTKLLKIIFYCILAFVGFLVGVMLFSQTGFFKGWVQKKIVTAANEALNGKITSLTLSGNFISNIYLEDIIVEVENQPFFKAERLTLHYQLSPLGLMSNEITIDRLHLESPEFFLTRDEQQVWNFRKLVRENENNPVEITESKDEVLGWEINFPEIEISSGIVNIESEAAETTGLPVKTKNLNLELGFWFDMDNIKLALQSFNFETVSPDFKINTLQVDADYSDDGLSAKDVKLETDSTKISSNINIKNFDAPVLDVFAEGNPISLRELGRAFPELHLKGNPKVEVTVNGPLHDLNLKCLLSVERGEVRLAGNFDFENEPYSYRINGTVEQFDLSALIEDSTLASDLNFSFDLNGQGTDKGKISARLVARVDTSSFMNYTLSKADLNWSISGDTVNFNLSAGLDELNAQLSGTILSQSEQFNAKLRIQNFDLNQLDSTNGLKSDLNFTISLSGEKFDLERMESKAELTFLPSTIQNIPISSGQVALNFKHEIGSINEFRIVSPVVTLTASGNLSVKHNNTLEFQADFSDFSLMSKAFPLDSLSGSGRFSGNLHGRADSLLTTFKVTINDAKFQDYAVKAFSGDGSGVIFDSGSNLNFSGRFDEIQMGETIIDTSRFEVAYTGSFSSFKINIENPGQFDFGIKGEVWLKGDSTIIGIDSLGFTGLDQKWQKKGDVSKIILVGTQTRLTPFRLVSGDQSISLDGLIDTEDANDFNIKISNLDFANMRSMFPEQYDFQAKFDFNLNLSEKLSNPKLKGSIELNNGKYSAFTFEKFKGSYLYENDVFSWNCFLAKDAVDSLLESNAKLPVHLSFNPFGQKIYLDRPFEFKISTRGLDLSFLQAFMTGVKDFQGKLVADIVLRNTLNNLNGVGPIRLINASLKIPEFGLKYEKINIVVVLNKQEMLIREFNMISGDGSLRAVEGKLSLARDEVESFSAKFKAENFRLINNKQAQVQVDGSLELTGSVQDPVFTGDFTVDRARLFYETIEEGATVLLTGQPFFVISDDSVSFDKSGALRFQKTDDVQEYNFLESVFYRNLHGEFSVYFPRNTWIRSSDTSIEIEGDIIAVKDRGPNFVLFGSLSVMRGFYTLFGNRFQITKGEMVFNGDPELNPEISIEAQTIITSTPIEGDRPEKHEFKVLMTKTLLYPEFTFLLDDEIAPQEDIASIFLLGQRYDDLKPSERDSVASNSGIEDKAMNLLTSQLLKKISGTLGQRLRLDVIQIESGGGLADSKVKVGKYVTPDVFVSVSQDFGVEGNQIIELEYQIPKVLKFLNLLLQASSDRAGDTGLDVIWKIEW